MDYLRLLYPDKMKDVETYKQAQIQFMDDDPSIGKAIIAPTFSRRNKEKESVDIRLRLIAQKVNRALLFLWFFTISFILCFSYIVIFSK